MISEIVSTNANNKKKAVGLPEKEVKSFDETITQALNEVYNKCNSSIDPELLQGQVDRLCKTEYEE